MRVRDTINCLTGLVFVAALSGCGSAPKDAPEVAPVTGKVTRKGQPFAGVTVTYMPIGRTEGNRGPSSAVTNDQGGYTLTYNMSLDGAIPGKHAVTLVKDDGFMEDDDTKPDPSEVVIPKELASREVEVPPEGLDGGAADFDLNF